MTTTTDRPVRPVTQVRMHLNAVWVEMACGHALMVSIAGTNPRRYDTLLRDLTAPDATYHCHLCEEN